MLAAIMVPSANLEKDPLVKARLVGFRKVSLGPNETQCVSLSPMQRYQTLITARSHHSVRAIESYLGALEWGPMPKEPRG